MHSRRIFTEFFEGKMLIFALVNELSASKNLVNISFENTPPRLKAIEPLGRTELKAQFYALVNSFERIKFFGIGTVTYLTKIKYLTCS